MKNKTSGWVFFANNDMLTVKMIIDRPELTGEVAFLCQQAIEKYFKGYLAEHGKDILKIHDLLKLYSEVKSIRDWNLDEIALEKISDLYTMTRYPMNISMMSGERLPTMEDARGYWEFAKKVEAVFMELVGK
ncbi:MAG: HEPN domain-containing protein [Chitinispirillales bacterium]|jgi:HEPN domain-containing protein|nr:HEPN domain-containing protein [Chitinispirillales bacterium]